MPRRLPLSALLALSLSACAQAPAPPAPAAVAATAAAPMASTTPQEAAMQHKDASVPAARGAIEGAIRDGNRPPPALRVCAHPLDGGEPTCIDTVAGATSYRIDVTAGRYVVAGQAKDDPGIKFAHAERVRCIRAPCPPDTAIAVEIGASQTASGIDLSTGEALPPQA